MEALLTAILEDDLDRVAKLLREDRNLLTDQLETAHLYDTKIFHWLYAGDTALHLAAAGHRDAIVKHMLQSGADPRIATKHRHATPLHYAADGYIIDPSWDETRQITTIQFLIDAGADLQAQDKNGATPLHRAVRTRCAGAVACLLDAGASPECRNYSGSLAFHLAVQNTGRGGSGAEIAIAAQREIIREFMARGISVEQKNGKGRTVLECATSPWIQKLLTGQGEG